MFISAYVSYASSNYNRVREKMLEKKGEDSRILARVIQEYPLVHITIPRSISLTIVVWLTQSSPVCAIDIWFLLHKWLSIIQGSLVKLLATLS